MNIQKNIIDLNFNSTKNIYISDLPYGTTYYRVKKGRCYMYYLEITKDASGALIERYEYLSNKRTYFSKYSSDAYLCYFRVKNTAILDFKFIDDMLSLFTAINTIKTHYSCKDIIF